MTDKDRRMELPKISLDDLFTTQEQRDYNNAEIMPMVDIFLKERYETVKEHGIERWKKIILNYQLNFFHIIP